MLEFASSLGWWWPRVLHSAWQLPYGVRVVLVVFVASWVALLLHELGHAIAARLLGVRIWGISLGRGPLLFNGNIGQCHVRVALLPLHGEVRLHDADALRIGYRDLHGPEWRFEWLEGVSWRASLISAAGGLMNLLCAKAVMVYWLWVPRPRMPILALTLCIFMVNAVMFLNLMPIRGLDGWKLAMQSAAWRRDRYPSRPPATVEP